MEHGSCCLVVFDPSQSNPLLLLLCALVKFLFFLQSPARRTVLLQRKPELLNKLTFGWSAMTTMTHPFLKSEEQCACMNIVIGYLCQTASQLC
uniref:Uncharacterized protein n=1 Tax=Arundo donax TaxID=35708 RepID=A0A0A9GF30_ARUDO